MMRLVRLHMISLGSLLILNEHTSAAAGGSKCMDLGQVNQTVDRFQRKHWEKPSVPENLQDTRTCAQAAREMPVHLKDRSLSPWRYSLNRDDNRFPNEIAFAECLCQGCILNQREDRSFNSVPVFVVRTVMRRTVCPNKPNEYVVKKDVITVPVACTCAVPTYTKGS